jgi:hypothetical protein
MTTKYHHYYNALIENARNRILPSNTYKECHHIIPRSLGGSNDRNNLVDLTAREHYVAHLLLAKMHGGEQKRKMLAAVVLMGAIKRFKKCNSYLYESMRLSYIETVREKSNIDLSGLITLPLVFFISIAIWIMVEWPSTAPYIIGFALVIGLIIFIFSIIHYIIWGGILIGIIWLLSLL